MQPPKTTDKIIKSLNLESLRKENNEVCQEFNISAKIVYGKISLEALEALVHDALQYRELYKDQNK